MTEQQRLYQAALLEMEAKGEYRKAIDLLRKIVESDSKDRSLMARTHLQLGKCYERLGVNGAIRSYQTVISRYADQQSIVAEARSRLRELSKTVVVMKPNAIVITQIDDSLKFSDSAVPSPNGTLIAFRKGFFIYVHNRLTLEDKEIIKINDNSLSLWARWSPDGKRLAYAVWSKAQTNAKYHREIHVVTVESSADEFLLSSSPGESIIPADWSKDGKSLLYVKMDTTGKSSAWLYSIDRKSSMNISSKYMDNIGVIGYSTPRLSSDGRDFITCVVEQGKRRVKLFGVYDTIGTVLTDTLMEASQSFWSHDGSIIFLRHRETSDDLMAVRIKNRTVIGQPILLKSGLGAQTRGLGMGGTKFFYALPNRWQTIISLAVDPATGKGTNEPVALTQYGINDTQPFWTESGEAIYHLSFPSITAPIGNKYPRYLISHSLGYTQRQSLIDLQSHVPYIFLASPDNQYIFFDGWNRENVRGLYALDLKTNNVSIIIPDSLLQCNNEPLRITGWDRKNMKLLFECVTEKRNEVAISVAIYRIDVARKQLEYVTGCNGSGTSLSPDGRKIVYVNQSKKGIEVKSLIDSTVRILIQYPHTARYSFSWPSWSPDGARVIYTRSINERRADIMSVSSSGGDEVAVYLGSKKYPSPWGPQWSPKGDKVAFTVFLGTNYDIWTIDHFLPK